MGDRYSFFPSWLLHTCARRGWIFVTPDYRLLPESTAHDSVDDAIDAYTWVASCLGVELDIEIESILLAGSSAGGYLAVTVAATVDHRPAAVLLIYGMNDPVGERYTTPGRNIFGRPAIETSPILARFPQPGERHNRPQISAYPLPTNMAEDKRFPLIAALHLDALLPDYLTGIAGLSRSIASHGIEAIPQQHRVLFPLTFASLKDFPPTVILHGRNDSAVPIEGSIKAAEALRNAGTLVYTEFPDDAEHGFDARAGNLDIESSAGEKVAGFQSLKQVVGHLDRLLSSHSSSTSSS